MQENLGHFIGTTLHFKCVPGTSRNACATYMRYASDSESSQNNILMMRVRLLHYFRKKNSGKFQKKSVDNYKQNSPLHNQVHNDPRELWNSLSLKYIR